MELFKHPIFSVLILSLVFFISCGEDESSEVDLPAGTVISKEIVSERIASQIKTTLILSGLDLPFDEIQYDISIYKVEYVTEYKNRKIIASGLTVLPLGTSEDISTVSFQHGTIASDAGAPSQLLSNDGQLTLFAGLASMGMLAVIPDFIGFGSSVDIMHPYYVAELTATTVRDHIYASKSIAEELGVSLNGNLYLSGYSQGGHATMSTHKYYEENGFEDFQLKASFPSSGGYDVESFRDYFLSLETYHQPFFLAYVAQSFNESLDFELSLSQYFNEPYASRIPDLFDGSFSGSEINQELNTVIADYITEDYRANTDDAKFDNFNTALKENSLVDWVPKIPVFMYHGDADITVPYQNSVDSYDAFIKNGASTQVVTFTTLSGGTHGTGVGPYIEEMIKEIVEFENQ